MIVLPALILLAALPQRSGELPDRLPGGVTILESPDLAARLADARRLLEEDNPRAALALLQEVLDADPAALVRVHPDDLLFTGAGRAARLVLEQLPPAAAAERERAVGGRARDALERALHPPDLPGLRRVAARFAGTAAARAAETAARELLLDRGEPERAAAGRPLAELMPAEWLPELPAPLPRAPLAAPSYSGPHDPRLPAVLARNLQPRWSYRFAHPPQPGSLALYGHRAAAGGGLIYLSDGREVVALRLGSGEVAWRYAGAPGWDDLADAYRDREPALEKLVEGYNPKTLLAPVLEDGVLLVALQEPIFVGRSDSFYRRIVVRHYLPGRRLYAFDAATGALLWRHEPAWYRGNRTEPRELAAAPPAAAAGRVFLPVYDAAGTLDFSLIALDLRTGAELWRTFLVSGGRETNLFGNVVSEMAAGPPVADERRVMICTNLGALCALDAASGAPLWTRLYRRTPVVALQTGEVSRRRETFPNGPPAYDGDYFVCAPTDSDSAWVLRAEDGAVVRELLPPRLRNGVAADLRHLVGLYDGRAVFTGSHAVFFDLAGGPGQDLTSEGLDVGPLLPLHGGALAAGELLVPTRRGIDVLDPATGQPLGLALAWNLLDQGSLQALPGMVLSFVDAGVLALGSPEGLVRTLPDEPDPVRLAQVLPLLEGLDFAGDPLLAVRVARAAEGLAAVCENVEQRERLALLAGRARIQRGELVEATLDLEPLLESSEPARRRAAAVALIGALQRDLPSSSALDRALDALAETPPALEVVTAAGTEPASLILLRGRALRAAARRDPRGEREALVELLQLDGLEGHREQGQPVPEWAGARLRALLAEHAEEQRSFEGEVAGRLADGPPTPGLLRAAAGTEALRHWLHAQTERTDLDRPSRLRLAAWLRDFGDDPDAARRLGRFDELIADPPLLPRPAGLDRLATVSLGDEQEFLAAAPAPDGAWVAVQEGSLLRVLHFTAAGAEPVLERRLAPAGLPFPSLAGGVFLDQEGLIAIYLDRWLRLDFDGQVREFELPGSSQRVAPVVQGQLAALLAEVGGRDHRFQIRDRRCGEILLDERLELDPDQAKELRFAGERAWVLCARERSAVSLELSRPGARLVPLPFAPLSEEVSQAHPYGAGIALPDAERVPTGIVLAAPDGARRLELRNMPVTLFAAPGGVGWIQRPYVPHESSPAALIGWLADGQEQPVVIDLPVRGPLFPQSQPRHTRQNMVLAAPELLVLSGEELSLFRLGAGAEPAWRATLPGVGRSPIQVRARRAADGWFVPVILRVRGGQPSLLGFLLTATGQLLATGAWETDSTDPTTCTAELLGQGRLLLRCGGVLHLLGQR